MNTAMDANDIRHGTVNGYNNLRCSCEDCRAAWAQACRAHKKLRKAKETPRHVHGTQNGYGNWGCRCLYCTEAWAEGTRARRARRKERLANMCDKKKAS